MNHAHFHMSRLNPKFHITENCKKRSRGYIPHVEEEGLIQSLTFRLKDSLPQYLIKKAEEDLRYVNPDYISNELRVKLENYLDSGIGSCALKHPEVAQIMEETLLKFDEKKYHLLEWCIMPNHVHVLIYPLGGLSEILKSWKSYTGRWISLRNTDLRLDIPSKEVWQRDYWDRYMRNESHLVNTINYIHQNPVKAGLCEKAEDWKWGSSRIPIKSR